MHPLVYAAIVIMIALSIAIILVLLFPDTSGCPEDKIALWSDKGWVCRD
jgi:hypothetical protein